VIAWLAFACSPGSPVEEVRAMHARGEFEASLEPLREYLDDAPDDAEAQYLYGVALTSTGRLTAAVWPLRRAMEDPDWATPAVIHLANISVVTTDWSMAISLLDDLLAREPEHVQALNLRAYARAQSRQDYEGALADADAALAVDPASSDALVIRAVALLGLGRVDEAGEAIEAASDHFEEAGLGLAGSPRFCGVRATFAKEKGELEQAEEIFDECVERFPTHFVVIDEAVRFFDSIGRSDRSLEIVRSAYEAMPGVRNYRMSLVYRLELLGEHEEAEQILVDATESPNPVAAATALSDLAAYYFERDRLDEAIERFEQALALVPDPGPTFVFAFADTLVAAGRYPRAIELTERMNLPSHRELILGRVALESGDPAAALAHFEEGLKLWPANAVARYFSALAAEQLGDFDRAIEEYRYSIRADSGATDARTRLARLYLAQGHQTQALEVVRHEPDRAGSDLLERALIELELRALLGQPNKLEETPLAAVRAPQNWARAVVARAKGLRARSGPEAAAREVLAADRLNLRSVANAPALESLVLDLSELGRSSEALARVDAALESSRGAAVFYALRGEVLARTAVDPEQARPSFEKAIELDADNAIALRGLARLEAAAHDTNAAVELYTRAAEADDRDTTALREAAALLQEAGRDAEAIARLDTLLERDPYAGADALQLARLMLKDGAEAPSPDRLRVVLRTAAFFEGSDEAKQLLEARAAAPPSDTAGS
jgi:tetratricopeptide (TPR) repeat protein